MKVPLVPAYPMKSCMDLDHSLSGPLASLQSPTNESQPLDLTVWWSRVPPRGNSLHYKAGLMGFQTTDHMVPGTGLKLRKSLVADLFCLHDHIEHEYGPDTLFPKLATEPKFSIQFFLGNWDIKQSLSWGWRPASGVHSGFVLGRCWD